MSERAIMGAIRLCFFLVLGMGHEKHLSPCSHSLSLSLSLTVKINRWRTRARSAVASAVAAVRVSTRTARSVSRSTIYHASQSMEREGGRDDLKENNLCTFPP